jgi:methyl acetate hydrolase
MFDDKAFTAAVEAANIAGAVAVLGNREGTIYTRAFGHRDVESGAEMAADNIFQIASMTKAITSVAALQLVEQGKLSLDAPLEESLPELANPQVIEGFDDSGTPILRAAKRAITLRHLLTHTAGFAYEFTSANLLRVRQSLGQPAPGTLASLDMPLLFDPGDEWAYGVSTDWVGRAVEATSGQSLGDYFDQNICGPLGMVDTMFHPTPTHAPRLASLYARGEDGGITPFPIQIGGGPSAEFASGGGGLSSTAQDYLRFLRMVLNGGALGGVRILSPETIAAMSRNQIGALPAGLMESTMPALANQYESFSEQHCGWSLAFLINPEPGPNGRSAGSLSWAGLANCYYWIDPAQDVIGILLTQLLPFGDTGVLNAFGALERMAYSAA